MIATELEALMHAVLDGEAAPTEVAALQAHLAGHAADRAHFDALHALFAELGGMAQPHPPEGLVAAVNAALPLQSPDQLSRRSRVLGSSAADQEPDTWPSPLQFFPSSSPRQSTPHSRSAFMSEQNKSIFASRKTWIGAGVAVAAVVIVVQFGTGGYPKKEDVSGTIVPAERYRAAQGKAEDMKLGDQSVAQLMQNDVFVRIVKDPQMRQMALDKGFQAAATAMMQSPDAAKSVLANAEAARFFANNAEAAKHALNNAEAAQAVLANAEAARAVLNNADLAKRMRSNAELSRMVMANADLAKYMKSGADAAQFELANAEAAKFLLANADLSKRLMNNAELAQLALANADLAKYFAKNAEAANAAVNQAEAAKFMKSNADAARFMASNAEAARQVMLNADLARMLANNSEAARVLLSNAELANFMMSNPDVSRHLLQNTELSRSMLANQDAAQKAAKN